MNAAFLKAAYKRNLDLIRRDAAGVGEETAHRRAGTGSSLNWVVGHVLSARGRILEMLGADLSGLDMQTVGRLYRNGTQPDPAHALPLAELLEKLEATQPTLEAAIDRADLSQMVQSPFGTQAAGELLDFLAWHEGYHAGQVAILKRLAEA